MSSKKASDFLCPEKFNTPFDHLGSGQFDKGFQISFDAIEVGVSVNDTWYAKMKDGSLMTSYEKLGYHANTRSLLSGFLMGPAPFVVHRMEDDTITRTVIKE